MERSESECLIYTEALPGVTWGQVLGYIFPVVWFGLQLRQTDLPGFAVLTVVLVLSLDKIVDLTLRVRELEGNKREEGDIYASEETKATVGEALPRYNQNVQEKSSGRSTKSAATKAAPCTRKRNASSDVSAPEHAEKTVSEAVVASRSFKEESNRTGSRNDTLPYRPPESEVTTGTALTAKSNPATPECKSQPEIPAEVYMVREVLKRFSSNNSNMMYDNLTAIINDSSKHLPEHAYLFVEKAVLEAANTTLVLAYAKLISRIIENSQGVRMKMLAIEVSSTLMAALAMILEVPAIETPPASVERLVKTQDIMLQNRWQRNTGVLRFAAELFRLDVLELEDLRISLIEPLMAKSTNETLQYVCKLLTWVGHRIHRQASPDCGTGQWFTNLLSKLEAKSKSASLRADTVLQLKTLIKLKNNRWDPYGLSEEEDETDELTEVETTEGDQQKNCEEPERELLPEQSSADITTASTSVLTSEAMEPSAPTVSYSSVSSAAYPLSYCIRRPPSETEMNAPEVFNQFLDLDHLSTEDLMAWLKLQFADYEEKQLLEFICGLTRLTPRILDRRQLSLMGLMLNLLMTTDIVSEDLLIAAIMNGIEADLPVYHRENPSEFVSMVKNLSIVLVTCWENRMQGFSWLIELGKIWKNRIIPITWQIFSIQVLDFVIFVKKKDKTRELFNNTRECKDLLMPAVYILEIVKTNCDL